MAALTLKANIHLCRRCCGNPFVGEVLAGCLERLQLGGNEHASPRDVVYVSFDVHVGSVVSPATRLSPELHKALVFAGITPAVAWIWGCSDCL